MDQSLKQSYLDSARRLFLLDYDGTLREFTPTPDAASPSPETIKILSDLAADPKNTVAVISGRDRATLYEWLGELPIHLIAEHGLAHRFPGKHWQTIPTPDMSWEPQVRELMESSVASVSGSHIETKPSSLVWHYRTAKDGTPIETMLRALIADLEPIANQHNLRVLRGNKLVEVIPNGIDKGSQAHRWLEPSSYDFVLAIGDDVTDEDLFIALPPPALTYKVGPDDSAALYRLADPAAVRDMLASLTSLS